MEFQNILICTNKYFRHNEATKGSFIPYPHVSYLVDTLNSTGKFKADTFLFDEYIEKYPGSNFKTSLMNVLREKKPDLIVFETWLLGFVSPRHSLYISNNEIGFYQDFLNDIKNLEIPIVIYWTDIQEGSLIDIAKGLENYVTLHNVWDIKRDESFGMNYIFTPAPINSEIYNSLVPVYKDIDISFVGKVADLPYRQEILNSINKLKLNSEIHAGGIWAGKDIYLTDNQCADIYRRSKIVMNFCLNKQGKSQVKEKVFETTLCGALLLEQENNETSQYFTPYADYIPWKDENDLIEKIKYYLSHDEERIAISLNGTKKANEFYTGKVYWELLLKAVSEKLKTRNINSEIIYATNSLDETEEVKFVYEVIDNSGLFNKDYYIENYPYVGKKFKDPLLHYILIGWKERKNPSIKFDTDYYLKNNPDVLSAGVNPLMHYIAFGFAEGRKATNNIIRLRVDGHKIRYDNFEKNNNLIFRQALDNKTFSGRKPRVLLCDEKWLYHSNENSYVPYNIISYMVDTLNKSGLGIMETFFLDEICKKSPGKNCMELLLNYIYMLKPDIIFINQWRLDYIGKNIGQLIGTKFDLKFFLEDWIDECIFFMQKVNALNIPIIIFWPDFQDWGEYKPAYFAQQLENYVLFHNIWDIGKNNMFNDKYVFTHTPIDNSIYNNKGIEFRNRDIDVCFIGSVKTKPYRKEILTSLKDVGINLDVHEDGAFFLKKNYLSHSECADIYNKSKIAINFSLSFKGHPQLKGRIFESMLCGCLLLEQDNEEIKKYFVPFEDYVPWTDKQDLIKKIKYFLENKEKSYEIATNGCNKAKSLYTGFTYWQLMFYEISNRLQQYNNLG